MHTNADTRQLNLEAEVPAFGKVYDNPNHIASIFGLVKMVDAAVCVTFDSCIDDTFRVWNNDQEMVFPCTPTNLYDYKPTAHYLEQIASSKNMLPPTGCFRACNPGYCCA